MLSLRRTLATVHKVRCYSTTTQLIHDWETNIKSQHVHTTYDDLTTSQFNLLANTIGSSEYNNAHTPAKDTVIPPCWHHVYFPPRTPEQLLAHDGYEREYFPPPPFSQRMWAGASMIWSENALCVGDKAIMKTGLDHAEVRQGRMGESVMVWINKDIENQKGWSMREQRCLVYHPEQTSIANKSRGIIVKKEAEFSRTITPSSIMLFRYSALTFNSHKIHFDHEYATQVENHPACLVHGPLSGTLLVDLLRTQATKDKPLKTFEYKCLTPLYVNQPLTVSGKQAEENRYELWITNHLGHLAVKGSATTY